MCAIRAFDLDELVDLAVSEAELADGVAPSIVAARSKMSLNAVDRLAARPGKFGRRPRAEAAATRWTPAEQRFLRRQMPFLGVPGLARVLGRSKVAIKIRAQRTGVPGASRTPGILTARKAGWMLGCCAKKIIRLIDEGKLPGWSVPGHHPGGNGELHLIRETALFAWAVNPENWPYFKQAKVRHPRLKRLLARQAQRWKDEWLTTGQAAELAGVHFNDVNRQISRLGKLPGVKHGQWYVRRSDIERYTFHKGKAGRERELEGYWTARADAFLVAAWLAGMEWVVIGRLMGWKAKRVCYRFQCLVEKDQVRRILQNVILADPDTWARKIKKLRRAHRLRD